MAFQSFCGVATLQVGVSLLAIVFILLASVVFAVNVFNYYYDDPTISWPAPLVFILVFVAVMVLTGIVMFLAAYKESRCKALAAFALIVLLTVCWLILSVVSFANNPTHLKMVCNHLKCPESFWLAELSYRDWRNDFTHCKSLKQVEIKQTTNTEPLSPITTTTVISTHPTHVPGTSKTSIITEPVTTASSPSSLEPSTSKSSPILTPGNTTTSTPTQEPETTLTSSTTTNQPGTTVSTTHETTMVTEEPPGPDEPTSQEEEGTTTEAPVVSVDRGGNTGARRKRSYWNTREMGSEFKTTAVVMTDPLFKAVPNADRNENTRLLSMLSTESKEETASYVYGGPFAGAIILFIINILFLLFSAFILWSYAKELQWFYRHEKSSISGRT